MVDGHDRLHAAVLEGAAPHALALVGPREERPTLTVAAQLQAERVAATLANAQSGRHYSVDSINRVLIEAYDDRPRVKLVTRAWPLMGGSPLWMKQVRSRLSHVLDADFGMIT